MRDTKNLLVCLLLWLSPLLLSAQINANHLAVQPLILCDSETYSIDFVQPNAFAYSDTVAIAIQNIPDISIGNIAVDHGGLNIFNDTIYVTNFQNGPTGFRLDYDLTANCEAHDVNSQTIVSTIHYSFNNGAWTFTNSPQFELKSPVLTFIGGENLQEGNAQFGFGTERHFYFTNTNNSAPYNGGILFIDSIPVPSQSVVTLDSVYLSSGNGTVLSRYISDSLVALVVRVNDLQAGDTLKISDIAFLNDCVSGNNNVTKFKLDYGCVQTDLCRSLSHPTSFFTRINFDPNDRPLVTAVQIDFDNAVCYSDTVQRIHIYQNTGQGFATGIEITYFETIPIQGNLTHIDTGSVRVYKNQISSSSELPFTISVNRIGVQDAWKITANHPLSPGDSIFFVFDELGLCLSQQEYIDYFDIGIYLHAIRIQAELQHPCLPSRKNFHDSRDYFNVDQQFLNLNALMGDQEEAWFEIDNTNLLRIGNLIQNQIAYDISRSGIEIDLVLERGLSLSNPDSLILCSTYNGNVSVRNHPTNPYSPSSIYFVPTQFCGSSSSTLLTG